MEFRNIIKTVFCAFVLTFSLISCTAGKKNVKNDIERKVVIGKAVHRDSSEANGALVSLFDVRIINDHDSIFKTYSTATSRNGCFVIEGVPDGQYLLYIYDVSKGKCDLSSIVKNQTSLQLGGSVVLKPFVTIKGRVINVPKNYPVKVIIPGFGASAKLDDSGRYVLSDVPAGCYELAFISRKSVDYLKVKITDEMTDTVLIKDFYVGYQVGTLSSVYRCE
ncbi:MAG TPA: hypothetical protein VHP36_06115 [Chitinispirillaceae bacterium]|nr:hypothetical protein [Chitinispirillaceae bacterium]